MKLLPCVVALFATTVAVANEHHHPADEPHGQHQHEHEQHAGHDHDNQRIMQLNAHQHGVGQLALMQQQQQLMISITLPADSLWGFEHAPQTRQQHDAVEQSLAKLQQAHSFFQINKNAGCQALTAEVIEPHNLNSATNTHMDITTNLLWQCDNVADVDGVSTTLFTAFPQLERLESQVLLNHVNHGGVITANNATLEW